VLEDAADRLDDDSKRNLERVRAASKRMAQLIDDLLGLSRVTRAQRRDEDVDLSAIAKASLDELRDANPDRKLDVTIAPGLTARGDSRLLRIALDNLLGNAVKFTATREVAKIEVGMADGAYFVRDNGVGFDERYASKLFGAFQRLHDANEFAGTGIGLATVQRIVRRHGGRVWATSELGSGATFSFSLG
jgi:signal transduction histidine kinase